MSSSRIWSLNFVSEIVLYKVYSLFMFVYLWTTRLTLTFWIKKHNQFILNEHPHFLKKKYKTSMILTNVEDFESFFHADININCSRCFVQFLNVSFHHFFILSRCLNKVCDTRYEVCGCGINHDHVEVIIFLKCVDQWSDCYLCDTWIMTIYDKVITKLPMELRVQLN